jgi:hypothetical protein
MEQALIPLPARKEIEAEDIAPYRKVRIYENISFSKLTSDDVRSVSNATSKEEIEGISSEKKEMPPSKRRSKRTKLVQWVWFCCLCKSAYVLGFDEQVCTSPSCSKHQHCNSCDCKKRVKNDKGEWVFPRTSSSNSTVVNRCNPCP